MKKYLLVGGAATAVLLIVLTSFTSVVGYTSVKNSELVDSPLFQIRTHKIIYDSECCLKSTYLNKGKEIEIPLPKRSLKNYLHYTSDLWEILLMRINKMNDDQFEQFIIDLKQEMAEEQKYSNQEVDQIIHTLQTLKNGASIEDTVVSDDFDFTFDYSGTCTLYGLWLPGCLLMTSIGIFIAIIIFFIVHNCAAATFGPNS